MNKAFEIEPGRLERTAPLLKQSQIEDMAQEEKRIAETINAPPHLRNAIQDRGQLMSTLKKLRTSLERDSPRKFEGQELDKAVKREKELREAMVADMCTQAEMRRNPPGAVDKLLMFEQKHKKNHAEWQNLRRRLYVSGVLADNVSERSLSNLELYRPAGGSGELPMDGAQIPQAKTFHGLGGRSAMLSEDQLTVLRVLAPDIYNQLALLTADQRDDLKAALDFDAMTMSELRQCIHKANEGGALIEVNGSKQELIARLKEHAGAQAKAA